MSREELYGSMQKNFRFLVPAKFDGNRDRSGLSMTNTKDRRLCLPWHTKARVIRSTTAKATTIRSCACYIAFIDLANEAFDTVPGRPSPDFPLGLR